jgi:membrane-bound metal-dependent hydrolase YbcI (DUF457 family)
MPFTPFHFGPGAALHALAPKKLSFLAFSMANVIIDIEPLYYMLTRQFRLHQFFHTYIGATLIVGATIALFIAARWFARRFWLPDIFRWRELALMPVVVGAVAGSYTHVLFDSIMHADITPFAPFSNANPLLLAVELDTLHLACFGAGVLGGLVLGMRTLHEQQKMR